MNEIVLVGCQTEPLASYLKALGVLRLIAEQCEPNTRGWWESDGFHLYTTLETPDLESFFLSDYQPTPVVAPWNGGSGFYPKDNKDALKIIEACSSPRFSPYQSAIRLAGQCVQDLRLTESPKDATVKRALVNRMRSEMDDVALTWLDACLSLGGENLRFPPLLGTGGNDGRLDFTNNFMQRLVSLIDKDGQPSAESSLILGQSLFSRPAPYTERKAIGQFSPGAAGSANGSTGFESHSTASLWDFVLMIEGAVMFAAATSRRLHSGGQSTLSYPFTTRAIGAGNGALHSADEANARAEIWLPIWDRPAGQGELKQLFSEGRVSIGQRQPKNGLEFARGVSQLGSARGVSAFERYVFLMRAGKAYTATPVGRYKVPSRPFTNLLEDLDKNRWLDRFDKACGESSAPMRLRGLQRPLRDSLFAYAQATPTERPIRVQMILGQLGAIERYAAQSPGYREKVPPLARLSSGWMQTAERMGSHEFQLAAAVSTLHCKNQFTLRQTVAPIAIKAGWSTSSSTADLCWAHPDTARCLAATLDRLTLKAQKLDMDDHGLASYRGCDLDTVSAWLSQSCVDREIHRLVVGLSMCASSKSERVADNHVYLPYTYRVMKLLFCGNTQLHRVGALPASVSLPNPRPIVRLILANNIEQGLKQAERRLRIVGLRLPARMHTGLLDPERLAAALLIPISDTALRALLHSLDLRVKLPTPEKGEPDES